MNPIPSLDPDTMPVQALVQLGRTLGQPVQHPAPGGETFMVVPKGYDLADLSKFAPPQYVKQAVRLTEPAAFVAYVNRFKTAQSLIFASVTDLGASFRAILDYHPAQAGGGAAPDRCAHQAKFDCVPTNEWQQWTKANGQKFDQVTFATWLEEHQNLIVNPKGADLLEFVTTLEGKNHVRFNSSVRLQTGGNALSYDEDVELQGRVNTEAGKMTLPPLIVAGIEPFYGVGKYEVQARLKFRIESRKLQLWFETVALHRIVRDAVAGVLKDITERTGITPLAGSPE